MISALTLVSLGLLQIGGIEIITLSEAPPASATNVIDPATAAVADIDVAVKEYALTPPATSPQETAATASPGVHGRKEIAISKTVAANKQEDFDLEGLKLDKPFVVLRVEQRPSWVEQPPQAKGDGEHFISVASDPWKTDFEANDALEKKLRTAVNDYINDQIGRTDAAQRIRLPQESFDQLVGQRYVEDLQFSDASIGAMKQLHAHLVFTPQFRAEIAERWKEHVVNARLLRTAVGAAGVLVLMVMAFGVLKRLGRR